MKIDNQWRRLLGIIFMINGFFLSGLAQTPLGTGSTTEPDSASAEIPLLPHISHEPEAEQENAGDVVMEDKGDAYLRIWYLIPEEIPPKEFGEVGGLKDNLAIVFKSPDGETRYLASKPYPFMMTGYSGIPIGANQFALIRRSGESETELEKIDLSLQTNGFVTLVITKSDGQYVVRVINESRQAKEPPNANTMVENPLPTDDPGRTIVFYNLISGLNLSVECKDPKFTQTINPGTIDTISGLPKKLLELSTSGQVGDASFKAESEADLSLFPSLSYVLMQDIYGRYVPAILPNAVLE